MSNMILIESFVATIVIIVLFLKMILIMDFGDFSIPQFFLVSFQTFLKLQRNTGGTFATRPCAVTHWCDARYPKL
jgi:hypothetical protein